MRNFALIIFCICAISCAKEHVNDNQIDKSLNIAPIVQTKSYADTLDNCFGSMVDYYPGSKELVTLTNGLTVEKVGDTYILESDMLFSDSSLVILEGAITNFGRSAATNSPVKYWPGRNVYYEFDSSFTYDYQSKALQAMSMISNDTGVRFVPAQSYDTNRIKFCRSDVNSSYVGMQGGTQIINIVSLNAGVIMHEILHSLGFFHEHSRADRDAYIRINTSNIKSDKLHNFNKYSAGLDIGPFDFNSIMLYGSMTTDENFVYNIYTPMITRRDGSTFTENRSYLSNGDIIGIRSIYGPPYHKLIVEEEIIEDYNDMMTEIYEVEKTFKICFYEDEECTIPATLTYPRNIKLRSYETYCDVYHRVYEGYSDHVITIPAGISEYFLETYTHYERYIQSIPYDVNTKRYMTINYH